MQYKNFGQTGLKISALCFGTMTFGGEADVANSAALFHRCREAGINFFDCANIYHEGRAEEILGRLIKTCRSDILISSKAYFRTGTDINSRGLSRRHLMQACEQSLKRLDTDYLDVYFLHRFDEQTPLEESLRAADDLIKHGKILYLGVSNFAAWQIMKGLGISINEQLTKFVCVQPMYNLVKRQAEVEILPMAASEKLAVISYNPLGGGLLTGKYSNKRDQNNSRLNVNKAYQARYSIENLNTVIERYLQIANNYNYSPVSLAIAWAAHHPAITAPLIGARTLQQLDECLKAMDIKLSDELYNELNALVPTPPPATDRNDELTIGEMGLHPPPR